MSSRANVTAVSALLAKMRAETGGSCAAFFGADRRPLAVDAAHSALEQPSWRGVVAELSAHWDHSPDLVQRHFLLSAAGATALAFWLDPHGILLVELPRKTAVGLARVRLRPLLEELTDVLDGRSPGTGGMGSDGRPLH